MYNTLDFARRLDKVPNAPYLSHAVTNEVKEIVEMFPSFEVSEDAFALYAHFSKGNPMYKVLIDSHLDHPGIVIDSNQFGQILGSFLPDENSNLHDFPVEIFDKYGNFICNTRINSLLSSGGKRYLKLDELQEGIDFTNSTASLKMAFESNDRQILMRSADNHIVTSVALDIIRFINDIQPEVDVTFVFSKLEEIRQSSATLISKRGNTPFGQIDKDTILLVLEAGLMGSNENTRLVSNVATTYSGGPMVRVADNGYVFATNLEPNLAESVLLSSFQSLGVNHQHGSSISNCNATAYSLFADTPNVVGLTIPCLNKHNLDDNSLIKREAIAFADVENSFTVISELIARSAFRIPLHRSAFVNGDRKFALNNEKQMAEMKGKWKRTAEWAKPRLVMGHIFPENLGEALKLGIGSVKSKL